MMLQIKNANEVLSRVVFSNYNWTEDGYPVATYCCDNCTHEIEIGFNSLEKHLKSDFTNLKAIDNKQFDSMFLIFIPFYFKKRTKIAWRLNSFDKVLVRIQRLLINSSQKKINKPPTIKNWVASSFLDFYCPKCKRPVRILYHLGGGGHHCEYGFVIDYVID